ncbi:hypothetical protein F3Y22_tig00112523pilonHSYRG00165 [Hibiscus syriacus]|uniref:Uncharacterized protein n=1 Tax=Hibiscus syriacus TaxID=106335 RepID=A0A6A2WWQ1_HIBSY|nr:hypothetical protein F3Y22_tig00112523pilonHSYRG00165 [Hibiscus syriacus]
MTTKFDIEKFNGRNFSLWKLKMKAILRKDGCLAAINERPMDFADDNKWNEMDGNAMENFHLALADEVLSSIEEKKIAKEIWDHLTKLYEATSLHNKIFLKRKLYTLRMPESTSVTEHLNTLNTLFSQLTSLSCKIGEQERAELLLQSLPDSYDQLIINLTNSNVTSLVFDDVAAAILQEENQCKNKEDKQVNLQQAEALTTTRERSTERGQSISHKHGRSKSRSKKNLKCYNCGKKGHLKKDCWSLNKNSNPQGNTANTSDDGDALCCEASTTVEGRKRFADIWLIDSGATYHMTSRREWFHHYEHVSGGSVYSYNDHALDIVGVETIKLKMYDGTIKVVRDVRHVKGFKKNLLSYGLLDNNASKIKTRKGIMKVFRGALVVLKGEKIAANLYMLKGETLLEAEASVASCSSDSAMLCHQKLGNIIVYVMYNSQEISKLDPKSRKCKFLGYADGVKGYRLWDLTARKVIISRDVIFVEDKLQRKEDDDSTEKSETTQIYVEKKFEQGDSSEAEPVQDEQEPKNSEAPTTRQSDRVRKRPNWHSDYVIEEEIEALHKNNTWDLVPLPQGRKPIGNKWVFKIKRNGDDQVERYRARLVVKGYAQKKLDVKTAFLHGNLEEEIYMLQPEGFEEKEKKNLVCRLNKSLYGLKQAPRCWYKRFDSFIMCLGYNRLNADPCAYFKRSSDNNFFILLLYVDDMLVAEPNKDHIEELKAQLDREFEMKDLGSANKILGMQIHRDRSNRKIWLSQKNYLKKILSQFSMQDCKPISTPLPINFKLSSSMSPSSEKERMKIVSSTVCISSGKFNVRYDMHKTRHCTSSGSDSGYAGDLDKSKSTTGYVFKVAGGAVSWVSKLQSVVATATTEAEYVAATQASKEAIWLKMLLEELGHNQEYVSLFCDGQSALHLARNPAFHSRTKHIRVQYHFIREKVEEETIDMQKIHTKDNIADFMTKAINADKFTWCRSSYGLSETEVHTGWLQAVTQKDNSSDLALAVDIWSLGCTIIKMFTGKAPWSEYEGAAAMFKVMKDILPIPETLSPEGKDFLRCCFRRNPAKRPTASMLLEHRFVKCSPQSGASSSNGIKSMDMPLVLDVVFGKNVKCSPQSGASSSNGIKSMGLLDYKGSIFPTIGIGANGLVKDKGLKGKPASLSEGKELDKPSDSSGDKGKSKMSEEEWEELDMRAASQIRLCLAKNVLANVARWSSTKELWEKLEEMYQAKSLSNRLYLKEKFHKLQMEEGTKISDHLSALNGIVSELESIGVEIDDEDKALRLIWSLPSSYEHMQTVLMYGKENVNFSEVTSKLISEERMLKNGENKSSESGALSVCGNRNKYKGSKKKIICWRCGQPGYLKKDCKNGGANSANGSKSDATNVVVFENEDDEFVF